MVYLYFKTMEYDSSSEWHKLMVEEFNMGLNVEHWNIGGFNYIAEIWLNGTKDLWRVREILDKDFSLFINDQGIESVLI